ncbi:MAG: hypothetical protein LUC88_06040, partial [Prevotella sp.]|nr:hypothetical protein [Prevotella sp.]
MKKFTLCKGVNTAKWLNISSLLSHDSKSSNRFLLVILSVPPLPGSMVLFPFRLFITYILKIISPFAILIVFTFAFSRTKTPPYGDLEVLHTPPGFPPPVWYTQLTRPPGDSVLLSGGGGGVKKNGGGGGG